jgi:hypothetical protein
MFDLGALVVLVLITSIIFVAWIIITFYSLAHIIAFWSTPAADESQQNDIQLNNL